MKTPEAFPFLQPLEPIPTGVKPKLERSGTCERSDPATAKKPPIRGIAFDIYGTLFISGSGDISLVMQGSRETTLRECLTRAIPELQLANQDHSYSEQFHHEIKKAQIKRKEEGIEWPEVEIREVWTSFLATINAPELSPESLEALAMDYEFRINPVWPMPGLKELLDHLKEKKVPLGIVSNAQFYTPKMFPLFLGHDRTHWGFTPEREVWSYAEREGKPSTRLYKKLKEAYQQIGLAANEVLYVGNDMRNDIAPAQAEGFQTALFAGDQRSLRWREGDKLVENVHADFVVTELQQIQQTILPQSPTP